MINLTSGDAWPPVIEFYARKVGQYPPLQLDPPAELRKLLGEQELFFRKGAMCERFSHGLGALAYYRRIVEDIIGALLNDLAAVFEGDAEKAEYQQRLEIVRQTRSHAQKIEIVKDLVPARLIKDSANPLGLLHAALSVGVHSLSD